MGNISFYKPHRFSSWPGQRPGPVEHSEWIHHIKWTHSKRRLPEPTNKMRTWHNRLGTYSKKGSLSKVTSPPPNIVPLTDVKVVSTSIKDLFRLVTCAFSILPLFSDNTLRPSFTSLFRAWLLNHSRDGANRATPSARSS